MQNGTRALEISQWLETPSGLGVAVVVFLTVPVVAVILDIADRPVTGVKLASLGHIVQGMIMLAVFWISGKSLARAIDESLEQQKKRARSDDRAKNEKDLLAAKKKIVNMLSFVAQQVVMISAVNSFAVFSPYGTAAPLLLFGLPMAVVRVARKQVAFPVSVPSGSLQRVFRRQSYRQHDLLRYYVPRRCVSTRCPCLLTSSASNCSPGGASW